MKRELEEKTKDTKERTKQKEEHNQGISQSIKNVNGQVAQTKKVYLVQRGDNSQHAAQALQETKQEKEKLRQRVNEVFHSSRHLRVALCFLSHSVAMMQAQPDGLARFLGATRLL